MPEDADLAHAWIDDDLEHMGEHVRVGVGLGWKGCAALPPPRAPFRSFAPVHRAAPEWRQGLPSAGFGASRASTSSSSDGCRRRSSPKRRDGRRCPRASPSLERRAVLPGWGRRRLRGSGRAGSSSSTTWSISARCAAATDAPPPIEVGFAGSVAEHLDHRLATLTGRSSSMHSRPKRVRISPTSFGRIEVVAIDLVHHDHPAQPAPPPAPSCVRY